ncbi:hypothetical protein SS05631_c07410 [Sinorhizobium sp. CCBAU 05631]|nr:hypothetical protein SS05631_c07410 [Sinorhizobium sp. CCBAU 05631]
MDFHRFARGNNGDGGIAGTRTRSHVDIGGGKAFCGLGYDRHERKRTECRRPQERTLHRYYSHKEAIWPSASAGENRPSPSRQGNRPACGVFMAELDASAVAAPGGRPTRGCRKPE